MTDNLKEREGAAMKIIYYEIEVDREGRWVHFAKVHRLNTARNVRNNAIKKLGYEDARIFKVTQEAKK